MSLIEDQKVLTGIRMSRGVISIWICVLSTNREYSLPSAYKELIKGKTAGKIYLLLSISALMDKAALSP